MIRARPRRPSIGWSTRIKERSGFGEFFTKKPLPYKEGLADYPTVARIPLFVSHLIIRCANIARGQRGGDDTSGVCRGVIIYCVLDD